MTGETDDLSVYYRSDRVSPTVAESIMLTHPAFAGRRLLTNFHEEFLGQFDASNSFTFIPYPFRLVLPPKDGSGRPRLQLTLALDLEGTILDEIDRAQNYRITTEPVPIECQFFVHILDGSPSGPQGGYAWSADPIVTDITSVASTADTLTAEAGFVDITNMAFPRRKYTVDEFPGLNRG